MRRATIAIVTVLVAIAVGMSAVIRPSPSLIWNASASVPIGLYRVQPIGDLRAGDLVMATPPEPLARFLAERGYLPLGVPLLKHIAAFPGQTICRIGRTISVDGIVIAEAFDRDRRGRDLPVWHGCRIIAEGEVFLINRHPEDSLDGRYFGSLPAISIAGRAIPVWVEKGE